MRKHVVVGFGVKGTASARQILGEWWSRERRELHVLDHSAAWGRGLGACNGGRVDATGPVE